MDTTKQLYEQEATGWKRGLYDDIQRTFRAPVVNWIFRTLMANRPEFLRYLWGQVKPVFQTRAFGRYTVQYRDAVLSAVESEGAIPRFRREEVDVRPAEYRELRGQIATFDVVAPRLALLFELADRLLHDDPVGEEWGGEASAGDDAEDEDRRRDAGRAATAPLPAWLDADRGLSPTLGTADELDGDAATAVSEIEAFHGLGDTLPSVYRCLVQWPGYLTAAWPESKPLLESDGFEEGHERADELTAEFVSRLPYAPRLRPEDLRRRGMDDEAVEDVQRLFRRFDTGPVETVLPAIALHAETVGAAGRREWD
ncbi:halocarboxylic acid dehydrogenase DehI family protein [Halorussus sp. MSC15.2]|uniref:halocarboxylic acid dehydrogenase DehI family protein n=1 Tax=Halorussus sp. MSC15.2 TaxID=2283638 RepID=UPI0013D3A1DE|nr:halocarboxylic acid dehydrogenase DehI family protein [Halorussus sp. MSC15.2]NEU56308.1 hypothetical protein [Halorussus sp. MSC15.2]